MSYKGLPFEVEWVELPDIAPRMKEIKAAPGKGPDGTEMYTLPVLRDPNTGAIVTDSWDIALYLDNTYPEKPVFPEDTKGLIHAFNTAHFGQLLPAIKFPLMRLGGVLRERSLKYYLTTRERYFNQQIEEWSPEGPEREQHWAVLEKAFETWMTWHGKTEGKWFMGNTFSYADVLVVSSLFWLKKVLHENEWNRIATWHDGQLKDLFADVERECQNVQ